MTDLEHCRELYYVWKDGIDDDYREDVTFHVHTAHVTRVTAKRVYFQYHVPGITLTERRRERHLDRAILEATGRDALPKHWQAEHYTLYVRREDAEAAMERARGAFFGIKPKVDIAKLRRAMADAHPDRGGTNEGFQAARERYLHAKQRRLAGMAAK